MVLDYPGQILDYVAFILFADMSSFGIDAESVVDSPAVVMLGIAEGSGTCSFASSDVG